jgi:hypothetical protein
MPTRTARTEYCKTCKYLRKHPKCGLSTMILEGHPYAEVAKRFKGKGKGWAAGGYLTIKKHWEAQHMVSRQLLAAKDISDRKKGLELMECQRKVWDDAQEAVDYALGRKSPPETNPLNLAVFGQCIAPMTKIIEVLAKVNPDAGKDVESDGMIEALKATAKDDWKDARPVQVATTEPETADGDELDAS